MPDRDKKHDHNNQHLESTVSLVPTRVGDRVKKSQVNFIGVPRRKHSKC